MVMEENKLMQRTYVPSSTTTANSTVFLTAYSKLETMRMKKNDALSRSKSKFRWFAWVEGI